jgi:hypothetical protein
MGQSHLVLAAGGWASQPHRNSPTGRLRRHFRVGRGLGKYPVPDAFTGLSRARPPTDYRAT